MRGKEKQKGEVIYICNVIYVIYVNVMSAQGNNKRRQIKRKLIKQDGGLRKLEVGKSAEGREDKCWNSLL